MCTKKLFIELNTFHIDDKDLNTNNMSGKSEHIFKKDDTLVHHQPIYVSFLDDSPVCHLPIIVLTSTHQKSK